MSGNFWLDGLILALSVFNIIVMLWLGCMILLNAQNRNWGVYMAAGGLLAGAIFFISHAAILGRNTAMFDVGFSFWWHIGWAPIIAAPYAWYVVMLWFSGYWDNNTSALHRRHRSWVNMATLYAVLLIVMLMFINPLGSFTGANFMQSYQDAADISSTSVVFLAYPFFILLCIGLSMDALSRPAPPIRQQGENARERARPWLISAGVLLLIVAGGVSFTIQWVWRNMSGDLTLPELYGNVAPVLAWLDLGLSVLITLAVVLVGQAVVSYEVFTGKPLPRRGLRRQWYVQLILAGGIAILASLIYQLQMRQIYLLIAAVVWSSLILAWAGWRFSDERDRTIRQLRPFLFSQNLSEMIFKSAGRRHNPAELQQPFNSLIHDLLGLEQGLLRVTDGLTQFLPASLTYPQQETYASVPTPSIIADPRENQAYAIDPATYGGFEWALPLWSQRGRDGILLLGRKTDQGFLTQEEMELARSAGERMIDIMITTEFAIQLINLQREKNTRQYLMEQKPRRVIHDEILPQLHTVLLNLGNHPGGDNDGAVKALTQIHGDLSQLIREMPDLPPGRSLQIGLVPGLKEFLAHDLPHAFQQVEWEVEPGFDESLSLETEPAREVLDYALREVIRNAAKYARSADGGLPQLHLKFQINPELVVTVTDNGQGFEPQDAALDATRGQGLRIHSLMMAIVGGSLMVDSRPGQGTSVRLKL